MADTASSIARGAELLDENEQLRTALESALEDNCEIIEDRDRLLRRVATLARELQAANEGQRRAREREPRPPTPEAAALHQSQTEEELRVAFEELQVLAEELEVANTSLQRSNETLESRVGARTREIAEASAALGRSEARFRSLVEGMPQLVWRADDTGDWTWSSPQWSAYTGQTQEQSLAMGWLDALHPDDRESARSAWSRAEEKGSFDFEGRICHASEARYRHFRTRAAAVRAPTGAIVEWLGTSTDVDDLIRLQEQQTVLVAELQHRTRNLMAVVQAVTMRTIKGSASLTDFRERIDDRMRALARVQGLLSRRATGTRITFDELLREELSAYAALDASDGDARVSLEGPTGVPLQSSLVQTFALALHELATNAAKYGALAAPAGHLAIRWQLDRNEGKPRLCVDWRETGVPDMPKQDDAPRGGGYGRELIERALPYQLGARTSYAFTDDGIHCTIAVEVVEEAIAEKADG